MQHPAALPAHDDLDTPAAAAHAAPRAADPHWVIYHPNLLVPSGAPHGRQRHPVSSRGYGLRAADDDLPHRAVSVMRFADRRQARLEIEDLGASIKIDLNATSLRALAFQLLDAAHDIEQVPAFGQIARAA